MRRSSLVRRGGVVAALATSVVLLAASAASAQSVSVRDAHHDVWKTTDQGGTYSAVPKRLAGDVHGATLRYGATNLVFTERFAHLARVGLGDVYSLALRTNTGMRRVVQVEAVRGNWPGMTWMARPKDPKTPVTCDGLKEHIAYAKNLVRVVVPASCLKTPRWVQFTAEDIHIARNDLWFVDNPMNTQARPHEWSQQIHQG